MTNYGWHSTGEEVAANLSAQIQNRTILITGVTPGTLGFETSRVIALQKPKLLIIAGRSPAKLQEAEEALKAAAPGVAVRQLKLSLSSQSAVRAAAAEVNGWDDVPTIDVLINNAGIMAQPFSLTEDGVESQLGTNHIGHFLFTQSILGKILAAGEGKRVVNVSSNAYKFGRVRFEDWNFKEGAEYDPWQSYAQSKTANLLYSKALAQRYKDQGLVSFSLHPGAIWTKLGLHAKDDLKAMGLMDEAGNVIDTKDTKWKTLGQGVATSVVAAFEPSIADQSGAYLSDCQPEATPEEWASDPEGPAKLWALSEKLVGENYSN